MEIKKDILWRVYLSFIGIAVLGILVVGKAFYIQQFQGKYWKGLSDSLHLEYREMEAERGTIYSEDGSMLSTSLPYFDIHIDFLADGLREKSGKRFSENVDSLAYSLATLFNDQKKNDYKKQLQVAYKNKERYFLLRRKISFEQYKALRSFPLVRQGRNKSGFIVEEKDKRINPFRLLANRTIGLSRDDSTRNVGLERTYDSLLKGTTGKRLVRRISGGAFVPIEGSEIEPENGKDIITTIDVNIQDIAENALMREMISNDCDHGTCIVMEVKTGKIKAIANLGRGSNGEYFEDFNYAVMRSEPGSTFKLVTLLSALEDGYVQLTDHVNIEGGVWQVAGRTVYDAEQRGLTNVTVKEAFEHSSNVGMAKIVYANYYHKPQQFINHLHGLHLDSLSGVNLDGESRPVIYNPKSKNWSATTLPWMGFGYNISISPLQTLMVYNAVANNGTMVKPYLVNKIMKDGEAVKSFEPVVVREKICSDRTLALLKECLEGVVTDGTAKGAFIGTAYKAAGKTGTALVANGARGYTDPIYQSSFAGYFPAEDPQYSMIVVIKNKPYSDQWMGAKVAGPVFREVADKLFAGSINQQQEFRSETLPDSVKYFYSGFNRDMEQVYKKMNMRFEDSAGTSRWAYLKTDEDYRAVMTALPVNKKTVPNVVGMGLKDALYLLENMDLKIVSKGKGRVNAQSIAAGSIIKKGQTIYLELN